MTRQNPRRTLDGIVAAFIILVALVSGCKDDTKDDAPPTKSSSNSTATGTTADDAVRLSAFRDGTGWKVVAFFPKAAPEAAPTSLQVVAGNDSLKGSIEAPGDDDLAGTPWTFFVDGETTKVTFQWTRRDGSRGERVWKIPQ